MALISGLLFILLAPLAGGLVAGLDRKITARMQRRIGPPIWQPFYDVAKLFQKENMVVRRSQTLYIQFFLLATIFTGFIFFSGGDLLLVIFALTLAAVFFVLAGFKASSPYSFIGTNRELLQMMAYEPAVLLMAVGMYMLTQSFQVSDILAYPKPPVIYLPGFFLAFIYILTIKLRKSPFDLSTSHHGHQEIVKGITTEFSGRALALIEIAHWYENVLVLGLIYLFFGPNPWLAVPVTLLVYFAELVVDNAAARVRWQKMLTTSWIVSLILGTINIVMLMIF
jgi:formate hydrogenlyase subunit 4